MMFKESNAYHNTYFDYRYEAVKVIFLECFKIFHIHHDLRVIKKHIVLDYQYLSQEIFS